MTNFSKVDNINMKITHEIYHSNSDNFTNSRTALRNLLNRQGLQVLDFKIDLSLVNFRELTNYPKFYTSLSHTKNLGAAVLAERSEVKGIGIDIEWSDRIIKPGADKFYVNKEDQHKLSPIELWTAKEAAFKSLSPMNVFPGVLVLSKIIIQENTFYTEELPDLRGTFSVYNQKLGDLDIVFTIAHI